MTLKWWESGSLTYARVLHSACQGAKLSFDAAWQGVVTSGPGESAIRHRENFPNLVSNGPKFSPILCHGSVTRRLFNVLFCVLYDNRARNPTAAAT